MRRTGKTPHEGSLETHYRLPYPPSELEFNFTNCSEAIARQGGDAFNTKIWWIP